jgi:hypothetical protein
MIKLQLLLRHPGADPELAPALQARLEALGLCITCCGRATISATIDEQAFERLFGPPPPIRAGFAANTLAAPELPVPAALQDAVSLITIAPRHAVMNLHPQEKHAAI